MQRRVTFNALVENAHCGIGIEHRVLRVGAWSSRHRRDRNRAAGDHVHEW
jgi:hypothetical protein